MAPNERRLKLRSRTGCSRCRTRRQKCDERRPCCTRCLEASSTCTYRDGNESTTVYQSTELQIRPSKSLHAGYRNLLPFYNASHSPFLEYFLGEASPAISCHKSIQKDTCQAVVSVGSVYPSLLYASLLFGAMHKSSQTQANAGSKELDIQILELRDVALFLLQSQLHNMKNSNSAAIIATALMLATCELRYDPEATAWRSHFECAKLLLAQAKQNGQDKIGDAKLWRFIHRRFDTLQFLVSLPPAWPSRSTTHTQKDVPGELPAVHNIGIIDSGLACCQDLLEVFRWIGALESIQNSQEAEALHCFDSIASQLVNIVRRMMLRDEENPPLISDDLDEQCDIEQLRAYRISNTIAQHVAIIYLYRYGLSWNDREVIISNSVRSIIELATSIPQQNGLHPSICLTTALFVAGCEAQEEEQENIKALLHIQHRITRNRNTQRTIQKLETLWATKLGRNASWLNGQELTCKYYLSHECPRLMLIVFAQRRYLMTLCLISYLNHHQIYSLPIWSIKLDVHHYHSIHNLYIYIIF